MQLQFSLVAKRSAATALLAVWATLHLVLLPLHGRLHRDDCANDRCGSGAAPAPAAGVASGGACVVCVTTALPGLAAVAPAVAVQRYAQPLPAVRATARSQARASRSLNRGPPQPS